MLYFSQNRVQSFHLLGPSPTALSSRKTANLYVQSINSKFTISHEFRANQYASDHTDPHAV